MTKVLSQKMKMKIGLLINRARPYQSPNKDRARPYQSPNKERVNKEPGGNGSLLRQKVVSLRWQLVRYVL